jgi:DNA-binding NarL/FixJ family response regulator
VADLTPTVRVVVVDGDPLVRAALTMMLDGADGIAVVGEAADGDEVAGVVDRHPTDVVLMDIRMPRVNGIVATRRLRARPNPPEVVVLTTFDTDDHVIRRCARGRAGSCSRTRRRSGSWRRCAQWRPVSRFSRPLSPAG